MEHNDGQAVLQDEKVLGYKCVCVCVCVCARLYVYMLCRHVCECLYMCGCVCHSNILLLTNVTACCGTNDNVVRRRI